MSHRVQYERRGSIAANAFQYFEEVCAKGMELMAVLFVAPVTSWTSSTYSGLGSRPTDQPELPTNDYLELIEQEAGRTACQITVLATLLNDSDSLGYLVYLFQVSWSVSV